MPLLLSEDDVRAAVSMDDLIECMQTALVRFAEGRVRQPLRAVTEIPSHRAFFAVMPSFIDEPAALGAKLVTVYGGNVAQGLPSHLATIVLLDPETGALMALMDGRYITEARTAAVSAVSVRLLALPGADTLAILGSGVQARSHLEAIGRVRALRDVRVWSPDAERRAAFVREMQARVAPPIRATASAREAVEGAGVIALATAAREPVLFSEWVADGAHICAVGACRPDQREMDTALVARARLFVDSRVGALNEAGDIVMPIREGAIDEGHIAGELGALAAGSVGGRRTDREVTVFKSLGMAVEDIAAAHRAYEKAAARGLGRGFVL